MSRPQQTLVDVLHGEAGACDAADDMILCCSTLQAGWTVEFPSIDLMLWFTDTFLDSDRERRRVRRMVASVDAVSYDLSRLPGGSRLPPRLVYALKRSIVAAAEPDAEQLATGARNHTGARVGAALRRLLTREDWHRGA